MAVTKLADRQAVQSVDLTSEVTGTLPLANGGIGATTFAAAGIADFTTSQVSNTTSLTPAISAFYTYIEDTGLTGTVTINNHTGTPGVGSRLWISLTGTASRSIAYGTGYEDSGNTTRPTTTSGTARLDIGFIWNPATSKWRCICYS